jgi:beta-lactam-binding protein with PASTA domain
MQTTVEAPSVVGSTLTGAVSTLNGAGLRLIYAKVPVASRAQAGKITAQTPGAGAQIPKNAQVLVFLAVYRTG